MLRQHAVVDAERPLRRARIRRRYYDRSRQIYELQCICPQELSQFPTASTFRFWNGIANDGLQYRPLEIGRIWPMDSTQAVSGTGPVQLFTIDKGAYNSDMPDLVPYTIEGNSQRFIVEANGFVPTGILENFRQSSAYGNFNSRLDDPLIFSIIQFIFILRGIRRYYFYTTPHDAPPHIHLGTLAQALHRATLGSRSAAHGQPPSLNSTGMLEIRIPQALGLQHPHTTMDPRLRAKGLSTTASTIPYDDITSTNKTRGNEAGKIYFASLEWGTINWVTGEGLMTDSSTPEGHTTDSFTPEGVENGLEVSVPGTDNET
ncbi:hypothetical protein C7974DRAFT_116711 [Boeremia exigua]|uniref:uncharacterized protein n=1 Tax=Boeremia exigua TaxID=749465 RepID=UPI001E8E248F|nr:uncharacterized protein C7974DRAFT_116711 [Boeremia exigua]KAH6643074.1 hypothetical protein C7974DRAFT_116711 [Boeremia exigua]